MTQPNVGLSATTPKAFWNKPLTADFKGLFKSLSSGLTKVGTGLLMLSAVPGTAGATAFGGATKIVEALTDGVAAITSIGIDTTPSERAWLLVRRSLARAVVSLVVESTDHLKEHTEGKSAPDIDAKLSGQPWVLERDFFENPRGLSLLPLFQETMVGWFLFYGVSKARAQTIAERLPAFFVFALHEEWREHNEVYEPLLKAIDTPFGKSAEQEREWIRYGAWLTEQTEKNIFRESFSLRQVYVPLSGYWEERPKITHRERSTEESAIRHEVDLMDDVLEWVRNGDKEDTLRILSGGPGSGKSSFAKMLAARLGTQNGIRAIFIPLHHFDIRSDLRNSVREFLSNNQFVSADVLNPYSSERVLLCLDGLDELAMQGRSSREAAEQFITYVISSLHQYNQHQRRVLALIGGREILLQSLATHFRRDHQVLHCLPYGTWSTAVNLNSLSQVEPDWPEGAYEDGDYHWEDPYDDMDDPFAPDPIVSGYSPLVNVVDQRALWWEKYGRATGKAYTSIPDVLNNEALEPITAQPLLNYLVALSYERGAINFDKQTTLNEIYDDLLDSIYQRVWGDNNNPHIGGMSKRDFEDILEEIAVAVWHGDTRTTTIDKIKSRCTSVGLAEPLEQLALDADKGVLQLLTAFYFRKSGRTNSGEESFEFTHKSFGEYLMARRLVRGIKLISSERERSERFRGTGMTEDDALTKWVSWCGPQALDFNIVTFFRDEIALHKRKEVSAWQTILTSLFNTMLRKGLPMEQLNVSYVEADRQARNAEEALLCAMNACSRHTKNISKVDWPNRFSALSWLNRRVPTELRFENNLINNCLSRTSFVSQLLSRAELSQADLHAADFSNAVLVGADLSGSDLSGAIMFDAILYEADLHEANLRMTVLVRADLYKANLSRTQLTGANLHHVKNLEKSRHLDEAHGVDYQLFKLWEIDPDDYVNEE